MKAVISFVLVVGVGILVVLLVALMIRRYGHRILHRIRRLCGRPHPGPPDEQVPVFSVVTIGASGSGKTLLLASMYHELQAPADDRSYFLTAPLEQVTALNRWYHQAADTRVGWPAGTAVGETRTFTFTVHTRLPSGTFRPIMRVNYLEYSGGLLTDPQAPGSTAQAQLVEHIDGAHGLVGVIDGYRVRQLLAGGEYGRVRLGQGIDALIGVMLRSTCPVTFVITKWDLLRDLGEDENATLAMVKERLMSHRGFRALIGQAASGRIVRLIPVSAVGPDFATLDEAGLVSKRPDGQVHPTNIDLPLCTLVSDLFEQVELSVDTAELDNKIHEILRTTRRGPAAAAAELGAFLTLKLGTVLTSLGGPGIAGFIGDAAVELFRAGGDDPNRRTNMNITLDKVRREIPEFRFARRRVLRELQRRVDILDVSLPSSRLWKTN